MGIPGQTGIVAFLTDITCGEACWEAREDVCHCCCGGKNHGVMRSANGVQPERTAKIDGYRYKLIAVGDYGDIYQQAKTINEAAGYRRIDKVTEDLIYRYHWQETETGAPARVKPVTKSQYDKWAELTAWRGMDEHAFYFHKPYLLWQKSEVTP